MSGILGKQNMVRMIDALRAMPLREIGGLAVTRFEDLRDPEGRFGPLKGATDAAARNFLIFYLGDRVKWCSDLRERNPRRRFISRFARRPALPGRRCELGRAVPRGR